ncbi:MAG: hypothetical protein IBJ12_13100 [Sphingomonadaceae bacterium]|nr:hypothetical protein [Sphingomonadaceae bacterium]
MVLGVDAQIDAMQAIWPKFALVAHKADTALWEGRVRPLFQTYRVGIFYRVPSLIENLDPRRLQPRVSILSPALRPRPGDPEGRLPHVYYSPGGDVTLCLFDAEAGDWSPTDLIAETTVPWTIEWLAAYEGWRATGKWTASGRHVESAHV